MKLTKKAGSGQVIFLLFAIIGGIMIAVSMGNNDPVTSTLNFFKSHLVAALPVFVLGLGFIARGIDRMMGEKRRYFTLIVINLSTAFFILALLYTVLYVTPENVKVVEGDTVSDGLVAEKIRLDLPDEVLVIGDDADLQIRNPVTVLRTENGTVSIGSFPFSRFSGMYGYINDAGISPQCEIHLAGTVTRTSFTALLPPGNRDTQVIPAGGKVITVLAPVRTFRKGRLAARVFDLAGPSYHMKIEDQRNKVVFDGILRENNTVQNESVSVQCGKTSNWVEIVMQKSGDIFFLYFCMVSMFTGILIFPFEFLFRKK